MNQAVIYLALLFLGLCFGSFAGAQVWRLRAKQLKNTKKLTKKERIEYEHIGGLAEMRAVKDRSRCLSCGYVLKWYDLIPLISWLSLGGKCRECRRPIGMMEPLVEMGMGLFFVLSLVFWPESLDNYLSITQFVVWLIAGVGLSILFIYDSKWFLLPDIVNFTVIALGIMSSILTLFLSVDKIETVANIVGSVLILGGMYLAIYIFSKGRWIGFGDVKLGVGLGLLLADWQLAFIALFLANLIGCIVVLPGVISKTLKRDSHISFGPLLITGFIISQLFGGYIIEWYLRLL